MRLLKNFHIQLILLFIIITIIIFKTYNKNGPQKTYQIDCAIVDEKGIFIRQYAGGYCLFRDNGDLIISKTTNGISYFTKSGERLWTRKDPTLHKIVTSNDKKSFITITSEYKIFSGRKIRADLFSVISFENKLLKSWSTFQNIADLENKELAFFKNPILASLWTTAWLRDGTNDIFGEITHANSIQEISANEEIKDSKIWKSGNYLIYLYGPMSTAIVLDSEMQKVLWFFDMRKTGKVNIHDLQLIKDQKLLFLNNKNDDPITGKLFSSVEIYNLDFSKMLWRYTETPPEKFYTEKWGGVQVLKNGNFLYTNSSVDNHFPTANEITPEGQTVFSLKSNLRNSKGTMPIPVQEIKQIDLSDFLKNNND